MPLKKSTAITQEPSQRHIMAKTHIVDLKRVEDGLILHGEWSGAPGNSGQCGLAITRRKNGFQLWSWDTEYGLQRRDTVDSTSFRTVIDLLIGDEAYRAAVDSWTVEIVNDQEGWGELLAMAWEDDELTQKRLSLLLTLTDDSLLMIGKLFGLRSTSVTNPIDKLLADAEEREVELTELASGAINAGTTLSSLKKALAKAIEDAGEKGKLSEQHSKRRQREISLYDSIAKQYCATWSRDNPPTRGGGMTVPRVGYWSLYRYVLDWSIEHGMAPRGHHRVPGRLESFNRQAPDFEISLDASFEEIVKAFENPLPIALRSDCRNIVARHRSAMPQSDSLMQLCEWLEGDGYDALERASGEVLGVAVTEIARDQFNDQNLRDWEGLTARQRITNDQRLEFIKERFSEGGVGALGESPFPSIFKFPLIDQDGYTALVGGYATICGQAGPEFTWLGVFENEAKFYDELKRKGIVAESDIESLTDSELLAFWTRP